jgi:AcrR family transcriptional regulator
MPAAVELGDTRTRLMRVGERLFAERGYDGISLRQLTAAAGVNLAAVNYQLGSKHGLLTAIFENRCRPMNEERMLRLAACVESSDRPQLLEQLIGAYIAPALSSTTDAAGGATFTRLRAMLAVERNELARHLIAKYFDATSSRFIAAFENALPHLSRAEVFWRFHFLLGALYFTMINPARIGHLSQGLCDATDLEAVMREMVPFVTAGFLAPPKMKRLAQ